MSSEGVRFWLDNKNVVGLPVASQGDQTLVGYHGRYYILVDGMVQKKAGKTLRYSHTTLPLTWKKTINGGVSTAAPTLEAPSGQQNLGTRNTAVKFAREDKVMAEPAATTSPVKKKAKPPRTAPRPADNQSPVSAPLETNQTVVVVECPYCSEKQEIPVEKGKSGRAFIQGCVKCQEDFAMRLIPVITYQAQVAGFR